MMQKKQYTENGWLKEIIISLGLVLGLFAVFLIPFYYGGYIKDINILSLSASILSASFVLAIRNPYNYRAFILGAFSSVLLAFTFFMANNVSSALTYLLIFFPAQLYSFKVWRKMSKESIQYKNDLSLSAPGWQSARSRTLSIFVACLLVGINMCVFYYLNKESSFIQLFFNALLFSSAILANYLLIYKYVESRIYWVIFSLAGIGLSFCENGINPYLLILFGIFLFINTMVCIEWIKQTR